MCVTLYIFGLSNIQILDTQPRWLSDLAVDYQTVGLMIHRSLVWLPIRSLSSG